MSMFSALKDVQQAEPALKRITHQPRTDVVIRHIRPVCVLHTPLLLTALKTSHN